MLALATVTTPLGPAPFRTSHMGLTAFFPCSALTSLVEPLEHLAASLAAAMPSAAPTTSLPPAGRWQLHCAALAASTLLRTLVKAATFGHIQLYHDAAAQLMSAASLPLATLPQLLRCWQAGPDQPRAREASTALLAECCMGWLSIFKARHGPSRLPATAQGDLWGPPGVQCWLGCSVAAGRAMLPAYGKLLGRLSELLVLMRQRAADCYRTSNSRLRSASAFHCTV